MSWKLQWISSWSVHYSMISWIPTRPKRHLASLALGWTPYHVRMYLWRSRNPKRDAAVAVHLKRFSQNLNRKDMIKACVGKPWIVYRSTTAYGSQHRSKTLILLLFLSLVLVIVCVLRLGSLVLVLPIINYLLYLSYGIFSRFFPWALTAKSIPWVLASVDG